MNRRTAILLGWLAGAVVWLLCYAYAPLHEDEAIYAAWARALRHDPLLMHTPVDKPPLFFYAQLPFLLWHDSPLAARLPNALATLATALIVVRASRRPVWALALFATMPLTLFFAASGFTDPLMLAFLAVGWLAWQRGKPVAAGCAWAAALLTKPTALLLVPAWVWLARQRRAHVRPCLLAAGGLLALAWAWDVSRDAPSWWWLGRSAYGSLGRPSLDGAFAWLSPAMLGLGGAWWTARPRRTQPLTWLAVAWIPLHIVLGFQPWDRYLLPLAPMLAWLGAELVSRRARVSILGLNVGLSLLLLTQPAPGLGGRDGRWFGVETLAARLPDDAPVYHHVLGRPLAYYAPDATLLWLPEGGSPPPDAWWGGRLEDPECAVVVWFDPRSHLALCRTSSPE